jgi:murein DD-endopeptidase MepM/ murein hydrolase activator NlpD
MISRQGRFGARRLRLTFAYGAFSRTLAMPRSVAVALLGLLPFVALLYLAATCYFVFHDDLLQTLTRHQVEMQYAYEDRLAALRNELETATEQTRADQTDFTAQLRALAARQDQVESRTALVAALAERIEPMRTSDGQANKFSAKQASESPVVAPSAPADGKPHPDGFDLQLRNGTSGDSSGSSSPASATMSPIDFDPDSDLPIATRVHLLFNRYNRVDRQDLALLADLQRPEDLVSQRIRTALAAAGLSADRLNVPPGPRAAHAADMGGPFVALPILSDGSSFAAAARQAETAIDSAERLRRVLPHVPLQIPLPGDPEITSGFGPRIDPFLGTPALHTGVDLIEGYDAPVRATAAGRVVSAGFNGGYGNMVEVDHGNGLSTRYAHLSSIDVVPGQIVSLGTVVGHVGATGRATGPHLHYEVRVDGEPVDPLRFMRAGAELVAAAVDP